tara:strand:- start:349 stop:1206 length:858 start_codon:yes stop_codon:yes gene_type:complete
MKYIILSLIAIVSIGCNSEEAVLIDTESVMLMDELKKENLQLNREISGRDSLVNNYAKSINEIRNNLAKIRNQEKLIVQQRNDSENLTVDNTNLVEEIQLIGQLMLDNKRLINSLNEQLKSSDNQLVELEQLVTSLTEDVQKKSMEIYYLQEELENMDASFTELFKQFNEKVLELDNAKDILNTAWYTYGSKNELLNNGVITKEGGFIGIGKNTVLKDDFNKSYFNEIKISELKEIPMGVKTAKLITSHPTNSYQLVGQDKVDKLVILDFESFWSNSKYLVVEVK